MTGGAGFIGSNLCEAILKHGCRVRCLDDLSTGKQTNVDLFADKEFFDSHETGTLFYDEKEHGLDIFAYVECDAYDMTIYGNHEEESKRAEFIEKIKTNAMNYRDVHLTTDDHIILLSTCDYSYTNGRMVLLAKIKN